MLRAALLLLMSMTAARAVDWKALKPQGYVSDFANVVDAGSKADLEKYCDSVKQSTGAELALVTVSSLEGEPIEDVANDLFRSFGVGQKGKDEGVLLLLVINDRRSRLEVGHGLEAVLPDGFDGTVLVGMRPSLKQGMYGEALSAAAQTIGAAIAQAKGVTITAAPPVRRVPAERGTGIPFPLIIGGLVLFFLLMRAGRGGGGGGGLLTGMLLGNLMGGGFGGRGGGGFGGFDSGGGGGGGFGGFGGGDSGGGGASSSW